MENKKQIIIISAVNLIVILAVAAGLWYWQTRSSDDLKNEVLEIIENKEATLEGRIDDMNGELGVLSDELEDRDTVVKSGATDADTEEIDTVDEVSGSGSTPTTESSEATDSDIVPSSSLSSIETDVLTNSAAGYKITYAKDSYVNSNDSTCVVIEHHAGTIKIADASRTDGSCTLGSEPDITTPKTEAVTIGGVLYTASGFEKLSDYTDQLGSNIEALSVTLPDGNTIHFGSALRGTGDYNEYLTYRNRIVDMVESYTSL